MDPGGEINWLRLAQAVSLYKTFGYEYLAVPWMVKPDITDLTIPKHAVPFTVSRGLDLIGSGEQGFLQMAVDGNLPPGRYVTLTPCFRDERVLDEMHHLWFAKVELIHVLDEEDDADEALERMMDEAWDFFTPYLSCHVVQVEDADHLQYDMVTENTPEPIELGSYGVRQHGDIRWVYGTGCAEPRLAYAIEIDDPEE